MSSFSDIGFNRFDFEFKTHFQGLIFILVSLMDSNNFPSELSLLKSIDLSLTILLSANPSNDPIYSFIVNARIFRESIVRDFLLLSTFCVQFFLFLALFRRLSKNILSFFRFIRMWKDIMVSL